MKYALSEEEHMIQILEVTTLIFRESQNGVFIGQRACEEKMLHPYCVLEQHFLVLFQIIVNLEWILVSLELEA
jgi:hypothetical protein